jgi:serine/threonine protein kinase
MALAAGTKLGPYEIQSPLGAGGMGEVYRALDTRLDRVVAIKVLPAHLSENPDARLRFDREARSISSLNHPAICALYDVGHQDGVDFLVMELLEGETLAQRLTKGPIPSEQVLKIAIELCDGLEKAHRSGVIHRDLKPGNIMLTRTGAKLMDFGLAKSVALTGSQSSAPSFTAVHAMTSEASPITVTGTVAGTLQYMSPEQLQGKPADARSDIFALGSVLYEMLTGQKPFQGKSQLSVASAILEHEPKPISAIQPLTPPALIHVIERCLAKDPDERWQSISDVKNELLWVQQSGSRGGVPTLVASKRKSADRIWKTAAIAAAVLSLLLAALLGWYLLRPHETAQLQRSLISPAPGTNFYGTELALSPDGTKLVYLAESKAGTETFELWVRPLNSLNAQELTGSANASNPFWSPDSRYIAFFAGGKLKRIDTSGGGVTTLCDAPDGRGGSWSSNGTILFAPNPVGGLYQVSEDGGTPTEVWTTKRASSDRFPWFLPDGKSFLFYLEDENLVDRVSSAGANDKVSGIYVMRLGDKKPRLLLQTDTNAAYAQGYIVYIRQDHLLAQKFSASSLQLEGSPVPLADKAYSVADRQVGGFSISQTGLLVYLPDTANQSTSLDWFDRSGKKLGTIASLAGYNAPRISPNGERVAFALTAAQSAESDIWIRDIKRGTQSRLTFNNHSDLATWSPDGQRIAYYFDNGIGIKNASGLGAETLLGGTSHFNFVEDWSPDGSEILFTGPLGNSIFRNFVYSLKDKKIRPLLPDNPTTTDAGARISPDGKWVAFQNYETGRGEIYVMPYPSLSGKYQVSVNGGVQPVWSHDGKELFFVSFPGSEIMATEISSFDPVTMGTPVRLFKANIPTVDRSLPQYDVSADGKQFLVNTKPDTQLQESPVVLVNNWVAELKKK